MIELAPGVRYEGNLTWLAAQTILLVKHGSTAYGLNTPTSDLDIKGVAVAPKSVYLGFSKQFEQAESNNPDLVVFEIRKFFRLAAECNPNIIEVLWVDESDILKVTPAGQKLRDLRQAFLSKKAKHTFSGYAMSQLKRIKGHYRWLKNPPTEAPTREEYGLPERTLIPKDQLAAAQSAIEKKLAVWNLDDMSGIEPAARQALQQSMAELLAEISVTDDSLWQRGARSIGYDDNFIELLDRERRYLARQRDWESYRHWLASRNPARAELEAKHGFDTKHAMHLVRLMRMCREILDTGSVFVKRSDREELLAIRNGAWSYEQLVEWSEKQDKELTERMKLSSLPHSADREKLDQVCVQLVEEALAQQ
jgi:uncharacterized protein